MALATRGFASYPPPRMFFLTPKYVKRGRLYAKEAEKRLAYYSDRWNPETIKAFEATTGKLRSAVKARDRDAVHAAEQELEQLCAQHCPRNADSWVGDNVEVFLVAIIVALGIRTYFLQPFTIPTASMQPTLFGITGKPTEEEPPNIIKRMLDFAWYGRTWHYEVAEADGEMVAEEPKEAKRSGWRRIFTYTRIVTRDPQGQRREYFINENPRSVAEIFKVRPGTVYAKGQPIVQGFTDTGDHVFVDKISYHFRKPKRGEVFVFDTRNLETIERQNKPDSNTQYYIKRLVAVGDDEAQILPPHLYINGEIAKGEGYERVMSGTWDKPNEGYRGYSTMSRSESGMSGSFRWLNRPSATFTVPPKWYFAMGDNSYQSSDSRDWGPVPPRNLMGTGVFVYWPFSRHSSLGRWGTIQ